ncbi:hypothetical protein PoB_007051500 [Plakobranchus ocellatus]|uniref:Apple domain-containing protein n=1 Tax=Plakobranchus ocellatus TaxID=259542 RepID=A0AAV4DJ46_9GAST|nr:hypothetical protein PoB_007051500 [Plakobranchus ocellatus]
MKYNRTLHNLIWADGADVAPDMPWENDEVPSYPSHPHNSGGLAMDGRLKAWDWSWRVYSVCGYHTKTFHEAVGTTNSATRPTNVTSSIADIAVGSYLQCTILCSEYDFCRAAHFDLLSETCKILGPSSYTDLEADAASTTFVRARYIGQASDD